jgi:hypothetical protein
VSSSDGVNVGSIWNSRKLDVHRWSEHPEVNVFVDSLWQLYLIENPKVKKSGVGRPSKGPKKEQFKVLVLDLYVCWCEDSTKYLGINLSNNYWHPSSRYNALHLSRAIRDFLSWLVFHGYVEKINHRHSDNDKYLNHTSRFRAASALISMFKEARFGIDDIGLVLEREVIILKGTDLKEGFVSEDDAEVLSIEYEDTPEVIEMRSRLKLYNHLLSKTHIDIGTLEIPLIHRQITKGKYYGQKIKVRVDQQNKYVRRIFSRGSWECHGRIYGGWWQQIGEALRREIYINGNPTVEVDYKAMHISLLNAQLKSPFIFDPYAIDEQIWLDVDSATQRKWIKRLVLCAINASDEKAAFSAFRFQSEAGTQEKRLTNKELSLMLRSFIAQHPHLEQFICKDQGIRLMKVDGDISASIIDRLTAKGIPVLTVHDSYIVQRHHFAELRQAMIMAALKYIRRDLVAEQDGFDVDFSDSWGVINEKAVNKLPRMTPCSGYLHRFDRFCTRMGVKPTLSSRGRGMMARPMVEFL